MYEFIKKTIKIVDHDHECGNIDINLGDDCTFNQPITDDKIKKAIKKLKNNKAPIKLWLFCEWINIKSAHQTLLPWYAELFNLIFDTGVVPELWLTGFVKAIYKGKCNQL